MKQRNTSPKDDAVFCKYKAEELNGKGLIIKTGSIATTCNVVAAQFGEKVVIRISYGHAEVGHLKTLTQQEADRLGAPKDANGRFELILPIAQGTR